MRHLQWGLFIALVVAAPVAAQDENAAKREGEEAGRSSIVKVDGWTIKKEVSTLTRSMKKFNGLIGSLGKANKDLGVTFKKYLEDPSNELLASQVEKKLAAYAASVSREFDSIIANQDLFTSNFRNLRHKLGLLRGSIGSKSVLFKDQLKEYKVRAQGMEKGLIELATKIKDPDLEPEERQRLKREFAISHRRFQMQRRYLRGYTSRYRGYQRLQKNIGALGNLFSSLHGKFSDLITNLENEKKYLKASIELQADTLKIKKIIREGIIGGEAAIGTVSEKLATLYLKVDTFTEVHDRISQNLNKFVDTQGALVNVTEKINKIGSVGRGFGELNKSLDSVIDEFADKTIVPELDTGEDEEPTAKGAKSEK